MGADTQRGRATSLGHIPAGSHLSHLLPSLQKLLTQQPPPSLEQLHTRHHHSSLHRVAREAECQHVISAAQ